MHIDIIFTGTHAVIAEFRFFVIGSKFKAEARQPHTSVLDLSVKHNPKDTDALAAAAASAAALTAANAALAADKAELEKKNAELMEENNALNKALKEAEGQSVLQEVGPAAFYFEIGKTTLSKKELAHLDFYLSNVLPHVDGKKVTVLTGSADKKTGTARRNQYLCEKRAEYLQKLLVEKYGIDVSSFAVKTNIANEGDAALSRAVIISFE